MFKSLETFKSISVVASYPKVKKKILKIEKNSLLPVMWQWHTFSQKNHCHLSLNDAASTRLARAHHGEQSTTMLHVFVCLTYPAIWSKFRHNTVMFFCISTWMPSCLGGSSSYKHSISWHSILDELSLYCAFCSTFHKGIFMILLWRQ